MGNRNSVVYGALHKKLLGWLPVEKQITVHKGKNISVKLRTSDSAPLDDDSVQLVNLGNNFFLSLRGQQDDFDVRIPFSYGNSVTIHQKVNHKTKLNELFSAAEGSVINLERYVKGLRMEIGSRVNPAVKNVRFYTVESDGNVYCNTGYYETFWGCEKVGKGYSSPAENNDRHACGTGTYSDLEDGAKCKKCNRKPMYANSVVYAESEGLESNNCPVAQVTSCRSNRFPSGDECVKALCSPGMFRQDSGDCVDVGLGFYSNGDGHRTACEKGSYSDVTNGSSCKACSNLPIGAERVEYGNSLALATNTCPVYKVMSCKPGFQFHEGVCIRKPAGQLDGVELFVKEKLYDGLLQRPHDEEGLKYWAGTLRDGSRTCSSILIPFLYEVKFFAELNKQIFRRAPLQCPYGAETRSGWVELVDKPLKHRADFISLCVYKKILGRNG